MLINEAVRLLQEWKTVVFATANIPNVWTIERQIREMYDMPLDGLITCHYWNISRATRWVMDPYILIDEYQRFISRLVNDYLAHESIHMIAIQDPLEDKNAQQ